MRALAVPLPFQSKARFPKAIFRACLLAGFLMGGLLVSLPITQAAEDDTTAFRQWVAKFWPVARAQGISRKVFEQAFRNVTPDPDILKAAENQPEFVRPIWDYLASAVSDSRIKMGRQKLKAHAKLLGRLEQRYGVSRYILLAIWGIESRYGAYMGRKNVIRSLATLAYKGGRRAGFGRKQLLAALKILQRGDITLERMTGSWAGAMGHTQFIPTTFLAHAVDYNGDGRRDIWGSVADALASAAHYLKVSGWAPGQTWGYEVVLPKTFNYSLSGLNHVRSLAWWRKQGVKRVRGRKFPRPTDRASLILPAGARGPAFLVINNFHTIRKYNASTAYALAVGHLADRIMGYGPFVKPWPKKDKPLARAEREELQRLLAAKGYAIGKIDGVLGRRTRAAVRAYQKAVGLPADGYPSYSLLERLRKDANG